MFGFLPSILSAAVPGIFSLFQGYKQEQFAKRQADEAVKKQRETALAELEALRGKTMADWYLTTAGSEGRTTTLEPAISRASAEAAQKFDSPLQKANRERIAKRKRG